MKVYALTGSHRTGKTTLAASISRNVPGGCYNVNTRMAESFKALDIDPKSTPIDAGTRIALQEHMLAELSRLVRNVLTDNGAIYVFDRSFIDLAAYAIYELKRYPEYNVWLQSYINRCISINNNTFHTLIHIPPGINAPEAAKSYSTESTLEVDSYLHSVLFNNNSLVPTLYLPEDCTHLLERTAWVSQQLNLPTY